MRCEIAMITTEYVKGHLEACTASLDLDCDFKIYCYQPFEEVETVYHRIPQSAAGIITSGSRFAESIRRSYPDERRPIVPLEIDDAALHRLFWRLMEERGSLDYDHIYSDFMDKLHMGIHDFLTADHAVPLSQAMNWDAGQEEFESLRAAEARQYQKLLDIWETGQFDFIVTRYSGLLPMLREKGVRVYYPFPSLNCVRSTCQTLLQELELRRLQDNQAAEIHINLWITHPSYSTETLFERRCVAIQAAVSDFFGSRALDHIVRRSHFGLDILTDRKTVDLCTGHFTVCTLGEFLERTLDFKVFIGYGLGQSVYQARLNAINATRESEVSGGSYLINEREELIGPLGKGTVLTIPPAPAQFAYGARGSGLSSLTISKVLAALERMPNQRITAQELALKLAITHRSANHFLSSMDKAGILQVVTERRTTTRGRPERVYGRKS